MRRRIDQSLDLDASLRQSRGIWLSLAIVALPFAFGGALYLFFLAAALFDGAIDPATSSLGVLVTVMISSFCILADVHAFRQFGEASRRLRRLRDDPSANVRPLPAPFQASLFGPYH